MSGALSAEEFADLMAPLGPFEPAPHLGVAVSGGPDSLALMLLAGDWAQRRGGTATALVIDHGLRPESASEAATAAAQLAAHAIIARVSRLEGLSPGTGITPRAREARYAALRAACAELGLPHLLLGHHAADQAETVLLRAQSGSGPAGLAGMARVVEHHSVRFLRPLLDVPPARLRATLVQAGLTWAEDPSNTNQAATRARLRTLRADRDGAGSGTRALVEAAGARARARAEDECETAVWLAHNVEVRPEGFAILPATPIPVAAFRALIACISGAAYPAPSEALRSLAAAPRPATLAGARLMPAGRLGPGLLLVREACAVAAPVPAHPGANWDRRFRLPLSAEPPEPSIVGALGDMTPRFRRLSRLPAAVLRTLPALWSGERPVVVPHLLWPDPGAASRCPVLFCPSHPAAGATFFAA